MASRIRADDVRASDAERESVVADLRAHAADGRLDVEELERRVGSAYVATTRRDLVALTSDLPRARRRSREVARSEFREHLGSYLRVMALLVAIWALTGMGYFWPIWPMACWGVFVAMHANAVRPRRLLARQN
jgi:class 3 adenylate cyclase